MAPSRKIPSNMQKLSTKMCKYHRTYEVRTPKCCNAVEMAASSSRMLQIARKTDRTADQKNTKTEKHNSQSNSGPLCYYIYIYKVTTSQEISKGIYGYISSFDFLFVFGGCYVYIIHHDTCKYMFFIIS